jgi:hypothetical protein
MGDADEFPDAILCEAIRASPFLRSCREAEGSACSPVSQRRLAVISVLIRRLGSRHARGASRQHPTSGDR